MTAMQTGHGALALAGPLLRTIWFLGLPAIAALWAHHEDARLVPAAIFAGAGAALVPPALFEVALPVILSNNPGGGSGMIAFFWIGIRAVLLAGAALGVAMILRRRAMLGARLRLRRIVALFVLYYAAMIVPRPTVLNETFLFGVGGALDPLSLLLPILPLAPWLAAIALAGTIVSAFRAPLGGKDAL